MTFEEFQKGLKKDPDKKECCACGVLFAEEEGTVWQDRWICFSCLRYDDNIDPEKKKKVFENNNRGMSFIISL